MKRELLKEKRHCKSLSIASGDGLGQMMAALSARTAATPHTRPKFRQKSMKNARDTGRWFRQWDNESRAACDVLSLQAAWNIVHVLSFVRGVRKIAKGDYCLCHVSLSVRPSSWNNSAPTRRVFIKFSWVISKIYRENSSFIKIWQQ